MRELSPLAVILGILIGIGFAAANAYIGLRVGITVSASIPAAVISMAVLRGILRRGTIRENNIVQTVGSAGEALAAGVIFTMPALFILAAERGADELAPDYLTMVTWTLIGGLIGVFFMIPLRRYLAVKEHGRLPFPEGTACAEVLHAGQEGGTGAKLVFIGLALGALYDVLCNTLGLWRDTPALDVHAMGTELALNAMPALLGVGYILGVRIAGIMFAGGALSWFVVIPVIHYIGQHADAPISPGTALISTMDPGALHKSYVRYIGAGAVALGGLIALAKSVPTIVSSLGGVMSGLFSTRSAVDDRTDRDLPMGFVGVGVVVLMLVIWLAPHVKTGALGAALVLGFGFFFVTVASRLVGQVGSTSNPVSGMTIATLLATASLFVWAGHSGDAGILAAMSVGALVCIAICSAGDIAQDLKTGYLVQATPWKQQVGQLIAVFTTGPVIVLILMWLVDSYGIVESEKHPEPLMAPQANLMAIIVSGIMEGHAPWGLIGIGSAGAVVAELCGTPALPFAVGLYLPIALTTPIMVGGLVRWLVDPASNDAGHNPGVLAASGLIAGEGLMGVARSVLVGLEIEHERWLPTLFHLAPEYETMRDFGGDWLPLIPFALLAVWLAGVGWSRKTAP